MRLTSARVKNAKRGQRPQKISDDGGLHLLVSSQGSKLWRWAYRHAGKQKTLALGVYPSVSLAEARTRRDDARRLLANGTDPSTIRKREKQAAKTAVANNFRAIAEELVDKLRREGRAPVTLA